MSAPCSWACRVSSTVSLADGVAVQAWMTTPGLTERPSSMAISTSFFRSSRVSDHHSPMPLVSHSMACPRSPAQ